MAQTLKGPTRFYGPRISTYSRVVCVVAEEKGIAYELIPTDPHSPEHVRRHPFGKAPAMEVDFEDGTSLTMIESLAIAVFLDDVGEGASLQPDDAISRAQMHKWTAISNNYTFPPVDLDYVLERVTSPLTGKTPDEERIARALPIIAGLADLYEMRLRETTFLAGEVFSLADIFAGLIWAPVPFGEEGKRIFAARPSLSRWLDMLNGRPSFQATAFKP